MIRRFAGGRVFTHYSDEAWHVSLFRIALIALLAGSAAAGPLVIRYGFGASWAGYLLPFAVLCGAAGALTTGLLGLNVFFAAFLTWYMFEVAYAIGSLCPFCTVCAAGCLVSLVGVNRLAAANGLPVAQRLADGGWDVLIALGWTAIIAAMLFSGIWL